MKMLDNSVMQNAFSQRTKFQRLYTSGKKETQAIKKADLSELNLMEATLTLKYKPICLLTDR